MTSKAKRAAPAAPGTAVGQLKCGAKLRNKGGRRCGQNAGARTAHPGHGRCWLHGGIRKDANGHAADPRLKTGLRSRYGSIIVPRIRELIERHEQDENPLDLLPEVAALRALFEDFINRYDVHTEALLAWHASFQLTRRPLPQDLLQAFGNVVDEWEIRLKEVDEPTESQTKDLEQARKFLEVLRGADPAGKPHVVMDLADAYRVLDAVGKMVERVEKIRLGRVLTVVSPEVQERLKRQVVVIREREKWKSEELLEKLGQLVWT